MREAKAISLPLGGVENVVLLDGPQTLPAHLSDRIRVKLKALKLLEIVASRRGLRI
jgi:hypothetical protein